jgi:hypothetical protein
MSFWNPHTVKSSKIWWLIRSAVRHSHQLCAQSLAHSARVSDTNTHTASHAIVESSKLIGQSDATCNSLSAIGCFVTRQSHLLACHTPWLLIVQQNAKLPRSVLKKKLQIITDIDSAEIVTAELTTPTRGPALWRKKKIENGEKRTRTHTVTHSQPCNSWKQRRTVL